MNIVFVINQPYPFGMAGTMRIKLFAEYLVNKVNEVNILISNQDNGLNSSNGEHNGVKFSTIVNKKIPNLFLMLVYPFVVFKKLQIFRSKTQKNIIVIYGDIDMYTLPFTIIGKLLGYKIVLDIVEDRILTQEKMKWTAKVNSSFRSIALPFTNKLADGVIVISLRLKNKFSAFFCPSNIDLIPVSAANIDYVVKNGDKLSKENLNITYCGSFAVKDGVEFLIEAFDFISKEYSNIQLTLLGKANDLAKEKILSLGNNHIHLTGYLADEEYWERLHSADILCMTRIDSLYAQAGFPFKLGEYLATGKPVIATDVSDVKYYLDDKVDVVIAKPSNTQSLISSLKYLICDADKRNKIGVNGYNKCRKFFNPKINSQALFDFLYKI